MVTTPRDSIRAAASTVVQHPVEQAEEERDVCAVCWEEVVYARGEGGIITCCQCKKEVHFTCAMKLQGKDCPSCREPMFPHAPGHPIHGDIWTAYFRQETELAGVEADLSNAIREKCAQTAEIHTLQQADFESKREIERLKRTVADQREQINALKSTRTSQAIEIEITSNRMRTRQAEIVKLQKADFESRREIERLREVQRKNMDEKRETTRAQREQINALKSAATSQAIETRTLKANAIREKRTLQAEIVKLQKADFESKREIDSLQRALDDQRAIVASKENLIDVQRKEIDAYEKESERNTEERDFLEREVRAKETQFKFEMDVKNMDIFALRQKLDTLKIENHTVDVRKRIMNAKNEEIRRLRDQLRSSQNRQ